MAEYITEEIKDGTLTYRREVSELIRCRDCKYFETNSWGKVGDIPLIIAHEICKKWGNGCKTSPGGFCFLGERREDETPEGTVRKTL